MFSACWFNGQAWPLRIHLLADWPCSHPLVVIWCSGQNWPVVTFWTLGSPQGESRMDACLWRLPWLHWLQEAHHESPEITVSWPGHNVDYTWTHWCPQIQPAYGRRNAGMPAVRVWPMSPGCNLISSLSIAGGDVDLRMPLTYLWRWRVFTTNSKTTNM